METGGTTALLHAESSATRRSWETGNKEKRGSAGAKPLGRVR